MTTLWVAEKETGDGDWEPLCKPGRWAVAHRLYVEAAKEGRARLVGYVPRVEETAQGGGRR